MSDNEFLGGIRFQFPREGAPSFNRARGWIDIAEAIAFLQSKKDAGNTKLNFNVNESKDGSKLIGYVDNWKPSGQRQEPRKPAKPANWDAAPLDDDIPF